MVRINDEDFENTFISSRKLSTYPLIRYVGGGGEGGGGGGEREGRGGGEREFDPNTCVHLASGTANFMQVVLAKGMGQGTRPLLAARRAAEEAMRYLDSKREQMRDLWDVGHFLLRAFSEADKEIRKGAEEKWECATSCLLVVLCVQLEGEREGEPKWGVVCANVGSSKAFLISSGGKREVLDITKGSQDISNDPRDCGGRLGPYVDDGDPDLRNLRLNFAPCSPDDVVFVMTVGVYNYKGYIADVAMTGEDAQQFRDDSTCSRLHSLLSFSSGLSPSSCTERMMEECMEYSHTLRRYLETIRRARRGDIQQMVGSMNHCACIAFLSPSSPSHFRETYAQLTGMT